MDVKPYADIAQRVSVEAVSEARTEILSFACKIPVDMSFVPTDPDDSLRAAPAPAMPIRDTSQGIVGTITFLGSNSIMLWFGWGNLQPSSEASSASASNVNLSAGIAPNLLMGPLTVAMPRSQYKGAFSSASPTSKLISSNDGIQSDLIAGNVADRLSQRLKLAVFCSCSLEETPPVPGCDGVLERQMLRSRAGALVEREVARLLAATRQG